METEDSPTSPSAPRQCAQSSSNPRHSTTASMTEPTNEHQLVVYQAARVNCQASHTWVRGQLQNTKDCDQTRTLRASLPGPSRYCATLATPSPRVKKESREMIEFLTQAEALGMACIPITRIQKTLAASIAMRLTSRKGTNVYQTSEYAIDNFPLRAAELTFPVECLAQGCRKAAPKWAAPTWQKVNSLFSGLLGMSGYDCAGLTRALRPPSESVVRVVATLLPGAEVSWVGNGVMDRLLVKFTFALADEDGEVHPPKNGDRNEMALHPSTLSGLRQQILADVAAMSDAGVPLSPGFYRQLQREGKARQVEALLLNAQSQALALAQQGKPKKRTNPNVFEIERIVQEEKKTRHYLVEWTGYHPSWEEWRAAGEVGGPVQSYSLCTYRHSEHLLNSGWCCCTREFALRTTPKKPTSIAEMYALLAQCHLPTREERFVLSHNPLPGEELPRPCTACSFAHDRASARQELDSLRALEAGLQKDTSKAGRKKYSDWRLAHGHAHRNVQPGMYGEPHLYHDFDQQILDPLHYAELGDPKTPWKHGVLNNASDEARQTISDMLKEWGHPLDCRRKEDNRSREQKWFTGAKWATFCTGEGGSPGGPDVAIAKIVHVIAEDMQRRGVSIGSEEAKVGPTITAPSEQVAQEKKSKPGSSFANRSAAVLATRAHKDTEASDEPTATRAQLEHVPSAVEKEADPEDLNMIRELYGSRAQTLINTLLSFDAYFAWYYPLKFNDVHLFDPDQQKKEGRAFDNCCKAIDMHEAFERLSIRKHGSFLPHGAIFKTTHDILRVGDIWAFSLSSLELQNAETKRVARDLGARRLTFVQPTQLARVTLRGAEGPSKLIVKKIKRPTTMALSTLRNLLVAQTLRRGDGIITTPASRRKERLFGVKGTGRTKKLSSGVKLDKLKDDYNDPRDDTCIRAFVRILSEIADQRAQPAQLECAV